MHRREGHISWKPLQRFSLLKLQGLSASVGDKPILHDIDLAIGAHETHVMMGT